MLRALLGITLPAFSAGHGRPGSELALSAASTRRIKASTALPLVGEIKMNAFGEALSWFVPKQVAEYDGA